MRRTALLLALSGCFSEPPDVGDDTTATGSGTASATSTSTSVTSDPTGEATSGTETVEPPTASATTTTTTTTTTSDSTSTSMDSTTSGPSSFCGRPENLGARLCEDFDEGPLEPDWTVSASNGSATIEMEAGIGSPPNGLSANTSDLPASSGSIAQALLNDPAQPITVAATVRVDEACGEYTHALGVLFLDSAMQPVFRVYALVIGGVINIVDVDSESGDQHIMPTPHALEVGQVGRIRMEIDAGNGIVTLDLDGAMATSELSVPMTVASTTAVRILAGLPSAIGFGPCETSTDDIVVP